MRNFEEDFDFEFRRGIAVNRTRDFRDGDVYKTMTIGSGVAEVFNPEREARIIAHQKRVQSEMSKLGVK